MTWAPGAVMVCRGPMRVLFCVSSALVMLLLVNGPRINPACLASAPCDDLYFHSPTLDYSKSRLTFQWTAKKNIISLYQLYTFLSC
jgi:hypothetical protein